MNHVELMKLFERWKLLKDDFDALYREDPEIALVRVDLDSAWRGLTRIGRTDFSIFELEHRNTDPRRASWVLARFASLFMVTVESRPSSSTSMGYDKYESYAGDHLSHAQTPARFMKYFDEYRIPKDSVWIFFLNWFNTGHLWSEPECIESVMRIGRDACSYIAEPLLRESADSPLRLFSNSIELRACDLQAIFERGADTIRKWMKEQTIENTPITRGKYLVNPESLPSDWKDRLSESRGSDKRLVKRIT